MNAIAKPKIGANNVIWEGLIIRKYLFELKIFVSVPYVLINLEIFFQEE